MNTEYEDKLESLERTLAAFMQRVEPLLLKKTVIQTTKNSNDFNLNDLLEMQKTMAASQAQTIREVSDAIFKAQNQTRAEIEKFESIKGDLKNEILEMMEDEEEEVLGDYDNGNGKDQTLDQVLKIFDALDRSGVLSKLGIKNPLKNKPEIQQPQKLELSPGVLSDIENMAKEKIE